MALQWYFRHSFQFPIFLSLKKYAGVLSVLSLNSVNIRGPPDMKISVRPDNRKGMIEAGPGIILNLEVLTDCFRNWAMSMRKVTLAQK